MRRPLLLLLAVAVLVGGCGVRLDDGTPPEVEIPAAEMRRQDAAVETAALLLQARRAAASASDEAVAAELEAAGDDARAHLDALGGVWHPPPPARTLSGPVETADPAAVLDRLRGASAGAAEAALALDGEQATLLASIAIARTLRADALGAALGEPGPGADDPVVPDRLDATAATDLCRTLDSLGYATEVLAARADGDRRPELAAQARDWRTRAQQVAEAAGVAGTADDPRGVTYALPEGPEPAIAAARAALPAAWLALVPGADGEDRTRVIAWAIAAARAEGLAAAPFPGRA